MGNYEIKPLSVDTWDAFARLVERHNGVFGGCWCTWHHTFQAEKTFTAEGNHALKKRLVEEDRAHAALVFDDDQAVAWAQYGSPAELPNIHRGKEYEATLDTAPPAHRITCIVVDKKYRRQGVTAVALEGAIARIAQAGGGVVEGSPARHQRRQEGVRPLQRDAVLGRGGRLHVRPSQRAQELCDAAGRTLRRSAPG